MKNDTLFSQDTRAIPIILNCDDMEVEWSSKLQHGLFPGRPALAALPPGERLFFGLYFAATGLHALHVLIGVLLLGVAAAWIAKGRVRRDAPVVAENTGLYWHLVDIIWIFILPLFYLAA